MAKYISILCLTVIILLNYTSLFSVQFTQEDRDRLIKIETRQELTQNIFQKQIDDLKAFILWGFGILFAGMGILIGFVIWDRRTALEPVAKSNKKLQEKEEKLERAIIEFSKFEPKLAKILRSINL
jgi:hypothetical protein